MTIDPQKEALYAEVTRRAGLYGKLFALQRDNAAAAQIDAALAALGECEAEIRRLSDEVNDRIWYKNASSLLGLVQQQVESLARIETSVRIIETATGAHEKQLRSQGKRISAIERIVKARPKQRAEEDAQRLARHQELMDGQAQIFARLDVDEQRLDRKRELLEDHERRLRALEQRLAGGGDG